MLHTLIHVGACFAPFAPIAALAFAGQDGPLKHAFRLMPGAQKLTPEQRAEFRRISSTHTA